MGGISRTMWTKFEVDIRASSSVGFSAYLMRVDVG
jgi:hypothetical protein